MEILKKQCDDIFFSLSYEATTRLQRRVELAEEQIELFPESAPQHPLFGRADIRLLAIGEYKMVYQILEDTLSVISFLPPGSNSALD